MRGRLAAVFLAVALCAAPVTAQQTGQLVKSVEHRLSLWGFGHVDGDTLSRAQLAALHLKLTNAPPRFGLNAIRFKQELKSILRRSE